MVAAPALLLLAPLGRADFVFSALRESKRAAALGVRGPGAAGELLGKEIESVPQQCRSHRRACQFACPSTGAQALAAISVNDSGPEPAGESVDLRGRLHLEKGGSMEESRRSLVARPPGQGLRARPLACSSVPARRRLRDHLAQSRGAGEQSSALRGSGTVVARARAVSVPVRLARDTSDEQAARAEIDSALRTPMLAVSRCACLAAWRSAHGVLVCSAGESYQLRRLRARRAACQI